MRQRSVLAIAAVVLALVALHPVAADAAPVEAERDNASLNTCLEDPERPLAVLILVDTSQSLKETDPSPEPARVEALEGAIRALDTVASDRRVFVEFVDFGSVAERSFPDLPAWSEIQGSSEDLIRRVGDFADRNDSEDTDYAVALEQAGVSISDAPEGACRLVTWFTDGELDIDFQGTEKTLSWSDPPITVGAESDEAPAEERAIDAICQAGGFADQLRGTTGDVIGDGTFLAAIAFGDRDFDFLEKIATNRDGDCGERPALGTIVLTDDLDSLTTGLIRGVDPAPPGATADEIPAVDDQRCSQPADPSNPGAFTIPSSVTEIRMRTEVPGRDVVPVLLAPGNAGQSVERIALNTASSSTVADGAQLEAAVLSPRLTGLSLSFPDQVGSWAGDWELRFCSTDGSLVGANGTVEVLSVAGTVEAQLPEGTTLRRGRSSDAVVQLVSTQASPRASDSIGSGDYDVPLTDSDDIIIQAGPIESDGSIRLNVEVPADFEPDNVTLDASLTPIVEVFPPGRDWDLTPWSGQLAEIQVLDLPKYPLVDPPSAFAALDQQHLTSEADITVEAVGPESAGCVTLVDATIEGPEQSGGSYELQVFEGEQQILPGDDCALELPSDAQVLLTAKASLESDDARIDLKLAGSLTFRSVSSLDPSQLEDFTYPFTVRVDPILSTENPETEVVLALLLLAVLAPLALLYLYNFVFGGRFDVVSSQTMTIPLVLADGRLLRAGDSGRPEPLAVAETDLRPWPHEGGRFRRVDIKTRTGDNVELNARISLFPWGSPRGTANFADAPIQVGPLGADRRFGRAKTPLTTSGLWLFGGGEITEEPRTDSDSPAPESPNRTCSGTLLILPGRGRELDQADEILNNAVEALEVTLLGSDVPVSQLVNRPEDDPTESDPQDAGVEWDVGTGKTAVDDDDWDAAGPGSSFPTRSSITDDDLPY